MALVPELNHKGHEGHKEVQNQRILLQPTVFFVVKKLYARFNARLKDPRSFWIFSCSSVMA